MNVFGPKAENNGFEPYAKRALCFRGSDSTLLLCSPRGLPIPACAVCQSLGLSSVNYGAVAQREQDSNLPSQRRTADPTCTLYRANWIPISGRTLRLRSPRAEVERIELSRPYGITCVQSRLLTFEHSLPKAGCAGLEPAYSDRKSD